MVIIMAKFELKFIDCNFTNDYIKVEESNGTILIKGLDGKYLFMIELDKSTAIKFAKTLRTEINKITEGEGN